MLCCAALLQTVLDVMRNCDSLDSRQQVMNAVLKASAEVSTSPVSGAAGDFLPVAVCMLGVLQTFFACRCRGCSSQPCTVQAPAPSPVLAVSIQGGMRAAVDGWIPGPAVESFASSSPGNIPIPAVPAAAFLSLPRLTTTPAVPSMSPAPAAGGVQPVCRPRVSVHAQHLAG